MYSNYFSLSLTLTFYLSHYIPYSQTLSPLDDFTPYPISLPSLTPLSTSFTLKVDTNILRFSISGTASVEGSGISPGSISPAMYEVSVLSI